MAAGSVTGTIYLAVQPTDLGSSGVILETGSFADHDNTVLQISIRQILNVLNFSAYDNTAVTALPNSKIVTLANTNPIFICVQWDQGAPSLQTRLFVNNSSTGVTSPASADLGGNAMGSGVPNLGCRDAAGTPSNGWTGNMWTEPLAFSVVHDAPTRAAFFAYQQALWATVGIVVP